MSTSTINPVSQVSFQIHGSASASTFVEVRKEMLNWMDKKAGRRLPPEAWEGQSFELFREVGYQPVAAVALHKPQLWACRLDDADRQIPQRTWTIEACLGIGSDNIVLFGSRLLCIAMGENPPYVPSIPRFVRNLVELFDVYLDGKKVRNTAEVVNNVSTTEAMLNLIRSRNRRCPVIVISRGSREDPTAAPLIDPDKLAGTLAGAAHVFVIEPHSTYMVTDVLGREYGVFNQGVRTYNPGFNTDTDQPAQHPLAVPSTIKNWDSIGPAAFESFLVGHTLRYFTRRIFENDLPPYSRIHELSLAEKREQARMQGASDKELLDLALDENEILRKKLIDDAKTFEGSVRIAEQDRDLIKNENEQLASEVSGLRARINTLEEALAVKGIQECIPIPESFENLQDWCRDYLSGSVIVLSRAIRIAKKSDFLEPSLAYKALLLLKNQYIALRIKGGQEAIKAWQDGLFELGIEEQPTFSGDRAGEEGDEYKVTWNDRKRLLERHLKGNSSREGRYGFRLYYFWDEDTKQVIVGSFPTHLRNRLS